MKTKIAYFKTAQMAHDAMQPWIDRTYPNRFQDARSITRIKIVEFAKGFAIQLGEYGSYLTNEDINEGLTS
jgi:hypothetical protein